MRRDFRTETRSPPVDKTFPSYDLLACKALCLPSISEPVLADGRHVRSAFFRGFLNPANPAGGFPPEPLGSLFKRLQQWRRVRSSGSMMRRGLASSRRTVARMFSFTTRQSL